MVYGDDPFLEIDTRFDRAEHLVGSAEYAREKLELFSQKLEDALIGSIVPVQEVDDHNVMLLPIAVTATYTLFDPLRVPWQVIVHDHRAELQVDPFGGSLGRDHYLRLVAEVIDKGRPDVGSAQPGDTV